MPPDQNKVSKHVKMFYQQMDVAMKSIESIEHETIYGYGAAQMLPTVAYHMKSNFSFMKNVLDDNPQRDGLMYPFLPIVTKKPEPDLTLEDASVLITALDSTRPILKRVLDLKARRVIIPINVF